MEPFPGRFLETLKGYVELRKQQATSALDRAANAAKEAGVSCDRKRFREIAPVLNERGLRRFVAMEARALGRGARVSAR
jgi:GH15 family glucan-1,4-alpha-glucosidase